MVNHYDKQDRASVLLKLDTKLTDLIIKKFLGGRNSDVMNDKSQYFKFINQNSIEAPMKHDSEMNDDANWIRKDMERIYMTAFLINILQN